MCYFIIVPAKERTGCTNLILEIALMLLPGRLLERSDRKGEQTYEGNFIWGGIL